MTKLDYRCVFSMTGALCATAILLGLASAAGAATQFHYTATTKASPAAAQGAVKAGTMTWECKGNECRTSDPRPTLGLGDCKALAQTVGPIASYGYKGNWLAGEELDACNAGIKEALPSPGVIQATQGQIKGDFPVSRKAELNGVQIPTPTENQSATEASTALRERDSEVLRDKSLFGTAQVMPKTVPEDVQNPAINSKLSEARKAQANEDLRFLQARDRLREGNVIIDGGSIFVYIR